MSLAARRVSLVILVTVVSGVRAEAAGDTYEAIATRVGQAQEAVRIFYRCLLGDNSSRCRRLLGDADAPGFPKAEGPAPLGDAWAYLRGATSLRITGIERPEDVSRLRMRIDISPDALSNFRNVSVVVPDHSTLKRCGVMKEVRFPLLWQDDGQQPYQILVATLTVNGLGLWPVEVRERGPLAWRRALCPASPDDSVPVP